jgi:PIN domain nuclease of toxin-antitoxin system
MIRSEEHQLLFSAASLWEIAIKNGLGRTDFKADSRLLRSGLIENDYAELPITSAHAVATEALPPLHRDPFDRLLVAQAMVEGLLLVTADTRIAAYDGPILKV